MKNLLDQMKKVSAEIGKLELERNLGKRYVSPILIREKKREFNRLQSQHKKLYLKGGEI